MGILINESWADATKGYKLGDSGIYESRFDQPRALFVALQKEYGKCVSKMYVDVKGVATPVGWVFQKEKQYDNSTDTFILETWVSVHNK